jgi:hypothetical protein
MTPAPRIWCTFGLALAAGPAAAGWPCPVANPQTLVCGTQGCSDVITVWRCNDGYGTGTTCGAPCTGAVTCCGIVVGYVPMQCNDLCAGCTRGTRERVAAASRSHPALPRRPKPTHGSRLGLTAEEDQTPVTGAKGMTRVQPRITSSATRTGATR